MTCGECFFFDLARVPNLGETPPLKHGKCRRNAPTAAPYTGGWPTVQDEDWCGEFRDRELERERRAMRDRDTRRAIYDASGAGPARRAEIQRRERGES